MTKANDLAFPVSEETTYLLAGGNKIQAGLTKREYFAAMAMQNLLYNFNVDQMGLDDIAGFSVDAADRLIEMLNVPSEEELKKEE
jgi:hypothetical protein